MKTAVVVFPGSNCEQDAFHAVRYLGREPVYVWHLDTALRGFDAVILPGGFSYGDYLRTGAIAAFSPIMNAVREFADSGGPVIGICNGFQILCESGLLPGVLRRNAGLKFRCLKVHVRVEHQTLFTSEAEIGQVLTIPINHFEGNYYRSPQTLSELEGGGRVVLRYSTRDGEVTPAANPNGALSNIAGIINARGNVLGMMPHPERAVDPEVGGVDGQVILRSMLSARISA